MKDYPDKLYDVKDFKPTPTKLDIGTTAAEAKLAKLKADVTAILRCGVLTPGAAKTAASNAKTLSLLSTGSGHARGGRIGGVGSGTSDSNLIPMSAGEEVIRATRGARYRPVLKAINNGSPSQVKSALDRMGLGGGTQTVAAPVQVQVINKSGTPIDDLIELHIINYGHWQQLHLNAGGPA